MPVEDRRELLSDIAAEWALDPRRNEELRVLKPQLVAQIEFTEFTPDGHPRHAMFCGLRGDKEPGEVLREE